MSSLAPAFGPIVLSSRALAAQTVPALAGGVPGQFPSAASGPAVFRWPFAAFCTGALLLPMSGDPVDAAALSLRWQDETAFDVFSDGGGQNYEAPVLALQGSALGRYIALQRPVADGDEWLFTVFNQAGKTIQLAGLFFAFMRPGPQGDL